MQNVREEGRNHLAAINFYQTPLQRKILINKIRAEPTLKAIFKRKEDLTLMVEEDIRSRLNGMIENFVTIYIKGQQGSRKSSSGISIASRFDPTFNADRIGFLYDEWRKKIEEGNPREFYQLDEQVFVHGTGTQRIVQDIQNLIETLRQRQTSMIMISPEIKYFPEEIFTYVLETIDDSLIATCPENPNEHEPRLCNCYETHKAAILRAYVRTAIKKHGRYIGFYILKIAWKTELWEEYQKGKKNFMERMKGNQLHNQDYGAMAKEIMNHIDFAQYQKNKKRIKLLIEKVHPQLTNGEAEMVAEQIRVLQGK